jgi:hypothetical protein
MIPVLFFMLAVSVHAAGPPIDDNAQTTARAGQETDPESGKPLYRVPRINSAVEIDAVLDEPLWSEALLMTLDYEVEPGENIPPPVRTEVLIMYDAANIYFAFKCFDPKPSQIRARYSDRDQIWNDDWIGIFLDTFNSGRRDYGYMCNPFGIQSDMIESEEGSDNAWDAIWDSAGRITGEGYIVEMAIPFNSLSFQRSESDQIWGVDLVRSYPRTVRHHIGVFPRDRSNNCYMCQAEKLVGFANADPGNNLEIAPTLSGIFVQEREDWTEGPFEEQEKKLDPGVTVSWGFTPNLTLSATANPDFSQVEADVLQLDINEQFTLFYPEKRPFFLEGFDFFNTRLSTLHTRTFADPDWGLKVTGKEGKNAIGLFSAQDAMTNLIFPGSQGSDDTSVDTRSIGSVFRFRRDVGNASNIGVMATDREGEDYYNRMGGLDATLKITPKNQIRLQALGSATSYPEEIASDFGQPEGRFDGTALDLYFLRGTRTLDLYALYQQISPDFRADIGFMPRADYRYAEGGFGYTWNHDPPNWYTMLNFGSGFEQMEEFDGTFLHRAGTFWFNYRGPLQSRLDLDGFYGAFQYGGVEFDDQKGIHFDIEVVPTGSIRLLTCTQIRDQIDHANIQPGSRIRFHPEADFKLGRHLSLAVNHTYDRLDVDAGRLYTANVSRLRAVYQFNRRMFVRAIVQYLDYERTSSLYIDEVEPKESYIFSQLLFSYKINPQTVLFLGYSDGYYGDYDVDLVQTDRTFFMKLGYALVL